MEKTPQKKLNENLEKEIIIKPLTRPKPNANRKPSTRSISSQTKCAFGYQLKSQPILLFGLFLLLFIGLIVLFDIIHRSHCTISANFYLYLLYFQ